MTDNSNEGDQNNSTHSEQLSSQIEIEPSISREQTMIINNGVCFQNIVFIL